MLSVCLSASLLVWPVCPQLPLVAGETNIQRDPGLGSLGLFRLGLERYDSDPTQFNPKPHLPIRSRPTLMLSRRQ